MTRPVTSIEILEMKLLEVLEVEVEVLLGSTL